MPPLNFYTQTFCLTGTFQSGKRQYIESKLMELGADVFENVIKTRPFCLAVGSLVTSAWIYSTHGRKLEAAVNHRDQGGRINIVSEDHLWSEIERQGLL